MRARLLAAATAAILPAFLVLGAAPAHASGGNSGDLKVSEVGDEPSKSNDPKVGCSFDLQWYGFERGTSYVTFESQGSTKDAVITKTSGPDTVTLGPAAPGTGLNAKATYTLAFTGADPGTNGYQVKATAVAPRADGGTGDSKTKVFKVDCARADSTPRTPETGTTPDPGTPTPDPAAPFDWNWQYANPTCDAVTVAYPSNIPSGQANDANVRFQTPTGLMTLNFHNNTGTWSGTHVFDFKTHPQWPTGLTTYHVLWVQVGGTNYHWQGDVSCTPPPVVQPETPFTWDWEYGDPTCTALTVAYPSNIPSGQANDANIRFESNVGQFTLNFHNNEGTWSGTHVFDYLSHPQWPAGVTSFKVVWTQVGGTNFHWQGDVSCVLDGATPKVQTKVAGFRTGTLSVARGSSVAADSVVVGGSGYQDLILQKLSGSTWTSVQTVSAAADGTARVTFPKLTKKGTYQFRLAVTGSGISTGGTTGTLTVRVR